MALASAQTAGLKQGENWGNKGGGRTPNRYRSQALHKLMGTAKYQGMGANDILEDIMHNSHNEMCRIAAARTLLDASGITNDKERKVDCAEWFMALVGISRDVLPNEVLEVWLDRAKSYLQGVNAPIDWSEYEDVEATVDGVAVEARLLAPGVTSADEYDAEAD